MASWFRMSGQSRIGACHFLVMCIVTKDNNFRAAWGLGNDTLFLITLRLRSGQALPQLAVVALDRIGGVDQLAGFFGEFEEGRQLFPMVLP